MKIGVLKEPVPETRVSILPGHIAILQKLNVGIFVESNADENAFASDTKYSDAVQKLCQGKMHSIILTSFSQSTHLVNPNSKLLRRRFCWDITSLYKSMRRYSNLLKTMSRHRNNRKSSRLAAYPFD